MTEIKGVEIEGMQKINRVGRMSMQNIANLFHIYLA
jgi:hypothetical protein